mgnify:CR=1 FL=1
MNDVEQLEGFSSEWARDLCRKFIFQIYSVYADRGDKAATDYIKELNLVSYGLTDYLLELVNYWDYRIGEMFILKATIDQWYIYRLGHGVYKIQATRDDSRSSLIPPAAQRLIIAVLFAGHKVKMIGHPEFVIIKI